MDLIGNNVSLQEQKNKKIMKLVIIILAILIVIAIGLGVFISYLQSQTLKVTINGLSSPGLPTDTFIFENGKVYVSIKDIAKYVGYTPYNGDYKQYSEDTTKCYVQNEYEIASFSSNSTKIYKTILETDNEYEYFDLSEPVKMINGKLYVNEEGIRIGCNLSFTYNQEKNRIDIFTLPYLVTYYANRIPSSGAAENDITNFSNQKALLYGMTVVKNEKEKYGVNDLTNKEIIGTKYASIKFVESTKEFIVTTDEKKMGIVSYDATTKIKPEYDSIKQIDKDLNLYLVKNNNKQGVINKNGKTVLYLEFDQIGIDSSLFPSNNIKNSYLLFDNCIPVRKDKKWGIYDRNGKVLLPVEYDNIGCIASTTKDKSVNNLLIIPSYEGIVVGKDKLYGIINSIGKELIPIALQEAYSITVSGEDEYYMTYQDHKMNIEEYLLNQLHIKPGAINKDQTTTNTITNVITDNATNTAGNQINSNVVTNQVHQ